MEMLPEKISRQVDKDHVTLSQAFWGRLIVLVVPSSVLSTFCYENWHPYNEDLAAYLTHTNHTVPLKMGYLGCKTVLRQLLKQKKKNKIIEHFHRLSFV